MWIFQGNSAPPALKPLSEVPAALPEDSKSPQETHLSAQIAILDWIRAKLSITSVWLKA